MIADESIQRFSTICEAADDFVLVSHINPDGDAIGSFFSLSAFLTSRHKRVRLVNQDPTPEPLRFLEPPGLAVEAYDPALHDALLEQTARVVLVDNSAPDRLGRMEPVMRGVAAKTLCIDHHPARDAPWADNIVDVDACATTAIIFDLARSCGWAPDAAAARAVYVGLATDTGFFRFNSTNSRGHEIAAELLRLGVDSAGIYQALYERNSPAFVRLMGHALSGLSLAAGGAVAWVRVTREAIRRCGAEDVDPTEILTTLLALDRVRVAMLFRELADRRIKVSLRSKGSLDVHQLAIEFGGGGHRNASGIVLEGAIDAAVDTITERATSLISSIDLDGSR